ncbi:ABC transporter ATP-binding protein, partial [Enterococcus sp. FR159]|nr:ABC transporter ATP-binding protein [Enterococcus sp. FR159]
SKTSEEILTLFQQLNNEGVTIILVTHDEETIEYCNRLIKVRDGKILEEVLT